MSSDDWYRNTEWNDSIAAAFEAKLKRARSQKQQYLRIQASCLAEHEPEIALALSDRYFGMGDPFDHAQAYVDRAVAYLTLERVDDAVGSYEAALAREREFPNLKTQASIDLPFLIATKPLPDRFALALSVLDNSDDRLMFPVDVFRWNAAYALILSRSSPKRPAAAFASAAVDAASRNESGFRYHQCLGLVGDRYQELVQQLKLLANAA